MGGGGGGGEGGRGGGGLAIQTLQFVQFVQFVTDNCTFYKLYNLWLSFTNCIQIVNSQLRRSINNKKKNNK